jgi:hypothetical protein
VWSTASFTAVIYNISWTRSQQATIKRGRTFLFLLVAASSDFSPVHERRSGGGGASSLILHTLFEYISDSYVRRMENFLHAPPRSRMLLNDKMYYTRRVSDNYYPAGRRYSTL